MDRDEFLRRVSAGLGRSGTPNDGLAPHNAETAEVEVSSAAPPGAASAS